MGPDYDRKATHPSVSLGNPGLGVKMGVDPEGRRLLIQKRILVGNHPLKNLEWFWPQEKAGLAREFDYLS